MTASTIIINKKNVFGLTITSLLCCVYQHSQRTPAGSSSTVTHPSLLIAGIHQTGYSGGDRGSAADSDVSLINTGTSNMSALASNTLHIHLKLLTLAPINCTWKQWRSQKFVMEGVQNRGHIGAGEGGGQWRGCVPPIKFSTFWS